jgi:hypothetical protein
MLRFLVPEMAVAVSGALSPTQVKLPPSLSPGRRHFFEKAAVNDK